VSHSPSRAALDQRVVSSPSTAASPARSPRSSDEVVTGLPTATSRATAGAAGAVTSVRTTAVPVASPRVARTVAVAPAVPGAVTSPVSVTVAPSPGSVPLPSAPSTVHVGRAGPSSRPPAPSASKPYAARLTVAPGRTVALRGATRRSRTVTAAAAGVPVTRTSHTE